MQGQNRGLCCGHALQVRLLCPDDDKRCALFRAFGAIFAQISVNDRYLHGLALKDLGGFEGGDVPDHEKPCKIDIISQQCLVRRTASLIRPKPTCLMAMSGQFDRIHLAEASSRSMVPKQSAHSLKTSFPALRQMRRQTLRRDGSKARIVSRHRSAVDAPRQRPGRVIVQKLQPDVRFGKAGMGESHLFMGYRQRDGGIRPLRQ